VGGAACPPSLIDAMRDEAGIHVQHAWGMTELSPLGTFNDSALASATEATERNYSQGRPVFGAELRIVDADGSELSHDGRSQGRLQVRGPGVCSAYYKSDDRAAFTSGWFDTGDVAVIHPDGYMRVTDRAKDMIKSGGEWISSVELENVAAGHPAVLHAAAIAVPDDRWGERAWVIVVPREGAGVTEEDLKHWFAGKVARWAEPDRIVFATALPLTATGKIAKRVVREMYVSGLTPSGATHV
jgi:fatty-acyl-CoA synthase